MVHVCGVYNCTFQSVGFVEVQSIYEPTVHFSMNICETCKMKFNQAREQRELAKKQRNVRIEEVVRRVEALEEELLPQPTDWS